MLFGLFKKEDKEEKKTDICAMCGKKAKNAIFEKGKFFDNKKCLDNYKKLKAEGKSDEEICEFC